MQNFEYSVETSKPFDATVKAVEEKTVSYGFRVLHTHDVAAALAEKGFTRDPIKIVEVCNARYANEALKKDVKVALMLPCPIAVYVERGKTCISTMRPSLLAEFYPHASLGQIAADVETAVLRIVDEAAR
jgi:uncharacterized protein (DUF302 family)